MKYIVELSEKERAHLMVALGFYHGTVAQRTGEISITWIDLVNRLAAAQAIDTPPPAPVPTATAPSANPTPAPSKPVPPSDPADPDVRELVITPSAITKYGSGPKECLIVEWKELRNAGRSAETKKARCWANQKSLWPRVLETVKRPATFLVKEKQGYISIVGVKQ